MLVKSYRSSIRQIADIMTIGSIREASLMFPELDSVVVTSGFAMKRERDSDTNKKVDDKSSAFEKFIFSCTKSVNIY